MSYQRNLFLSWLVPLALLMIWQFSVNSGWVSNRILPEPLQVMNAGWRLIKSGELWENMVVSTLRASIGFIIGGSIGLILGLITGLSRLGETLLDSSIQMIRNIPHLALIPLVILWFGIDEKAKIFLVSLGTFFPIYLNTLHGIRHIDRGLIEMAKSYGLNARMSSTLDRLSDGRLLVNVVTGGDPIENRGDGIFLNHEERYKVTKEFLEVYKRLIRGEQQVNYQGKHINVENAGLLFPPVQPLGPPLYFGGSSPAALAVAAEHINTYLSWGEPIADVTEKITAVRKLADEKGNQLEFGIRLHVIVRETEQEAIDAANKLISHLDDEVIAQAQSIFSRMDSMGQKRMQALHNGSKDSLFIAPNLWAGIGLVRGGAGTALVGSPEQVAERIRGYQAVGISKFIFSGYPHLEEAHRFAELVMPLLQGLKEFSFSSSCINTGPFGETIANDSRPK